MVMMKEKLITAVEPGDWVVLEATISGIVKPVLVLWIFNRVSAGVGSSGGLSREVRVEFGFVRTGSAAVNTMNWPAHWVVMVP